MISVPWHERVIYFRYDIALSCDDICLRHMRNGYYIMLAKQVKRTSCVKCALGTIKGGILHFTEGMKILNLQSYVVLIADLWYYIEKRRIYNG